MCAIYSIYITPDTPLYHTETILRLWGDTWKGWMAEEVQSLVAAFTHTPLSTYMRILAAPLTGDFSDAALLLERLGRSLGQAWQHREKTQFVQALGNLLNIGCALSRLALSRLVGSLRGCLAPNLRRMV